TGNRHQCTNQGRQVGAERSKRDPGEHGIGNSGLLAGVSGEIHQHKNDRNPGNQCKEHLPSTKPKREEACRERIAAQRMNVRHPHRKQRIETPRAVLRRCEVFVVQTPADPRRNDVRHLALTSQTPTLVPIYSAMQAGNRPVEAQHPGSTGTNLHVPGEASNVWSRAASKIWASRCPERVAAWPWM